MRQRLEEREKLRAQQQMALTPPSEGPRRQRKVRFFEDVLVGVEACLDDRLQAASTSSVVQLPVEVRQAEMQLVHLEMAKDHFAWRLTTTLLHSGALQHPLVPCSAELGDAATSTSSSRALAEWEENLLASLEGEGEELKEAWHVACATCERLILEFQASHASALQEGEVEAWRTHTLRRVACLLLTQEMPKEEWSTLLQQLHSAITLDEWAGHVTIAELAGSRPVPLSFAQPAQLTEQIRRHAVFEWHRQWRQEHQPESAQERPVAWLLSHDLGELNRTMALGYSVFDLGRWAHKEDDGVLWFGEDALRALQLKVADEMQSAPALLRAQWSEATPAQHHQVIQTLARLCGHAVHAGHLPSLLNQEEEGRLQNIQALAEQIQSSKRKGFGWELWELLRTELQHFSIGGELCECACLPDLGPPEQTALQTLRSLPIRWPPDLLPTTGPLKPAQALHPLFCVRLTEFVEKEHSWLSHEQQQLASEAISDLQRAVASARWQEATERALEALAHFEWDALSIEAQTLAYRQWLVSGPWQEDIPVVLEPHTEALWCALNGLGALKEDSEHAMATRLVQGGDFLYHTLCLYSSILIWKSMGAPCHGGAHAGHSPDQGAGQISGVSLQEILEVCLEQDALTQESWNYLKQHGYAKSDLHPWLARRMSCPQTTARNSPHTLAKLKKSAEQGEQAAHCRRLQQEVVQTEKVAKSILKTPGTTNISRLQRR